MLLNFCSASASFCLRVSKGIAAFACVLLVSLANIVQHTTAVAAAPPALNISHFDRCAPCFIAHALQYCNYEVGGSSMGSKQTPTDDDSVSTGC
jgi:hypothetical protein